MFARPLSLLALLLAVAAPAATAQVSLMPHVGYDLDVEGLFFGGGIEVGLPIVAPVAVSARLSGEYIPGADIVVAGRDFKQEVAQGHLDLIARLRAPGIQPYGGVGLAVRRLSLDTSDDDAVEGDQDVVETSIGANLIGGVSLMALGPVRPFAQVRLTVADGTAIAVMGGLALSF